MGYDFNQVRKPNAKLIKGTIDKLGTIFAIEMGADGFSAVNNIVEPMPTDIKEYLEGNDNITIFACASNIDKLCVGALMSFPNIEDLYLFKNDGVVSFETASTDLDQDTQDYLNDLNYLTNLKLIFVASDYVSSYSSFTIITSGYQSFTNVDDYVGKVVDTNLINNKYTTFTSVDDYLKSYVVYNGVITYVTNDNKNDLGIVAGTTIAYFGASAYKVTNDNKNSLYIVSGVTIAYDRYVTNIVEDYTLTIPFVGDTKLTSEYVDSVISMLSSAQKNAITKVVIPTDFSSESAKSIAWGYDFNAIVNLNNNIWYGNTQYDFSAWTIEGSGTLTSEIVESSINSISSGKLSGVSKVVVSGFTYNAQDTDTFISLSSLINCEYFEIRGKFSGTNKTSGYGTSFSVPKYIGTGNLPQSIKTLFVYRSSGSTISFKGDDISNLETIYFGGKVIWTYSDLINSSTLKKFIFKETISYPNNTSFQNLLSLANAELVIFSKEIGNVVVINWYSSLSCNPSKTKVYFESDTVDMFSGSTSNPNVKNIYFKANVLLNALDKFTTLGSNWNSSWKPKSIGYLDYTDTIPTFTGYTDQWYEDEDTTIPISTQDFVSGNRYYVKLTAI